MREIKFRAWDKFEKRFSYIHVHPCGIQWASPNWIDQSLSHDKDDNICGVQFGGISSIQQYTGLKDKNGLTEIYEGDIIDSEGNIKGNIYENNLDKRETDTVIQGLGTKTWCETYRRAIFCGCKDSE